jgi:hypothetical protein
MFPACHLLYSVGICTKARSIQGFWINRLPVSQALFLLLVAKIQKIDRSFAPGRFFKNISTGNAFDLFKSPEKYRCTKLV